MSITYTDAMALLLKARSRDDGKPLANNTRLFAVAQVAANGLTFPGAGVDYVVRFHATDVVTVRADGCYMLDSGGWRTVTTLERINRFSPAQVYSERGTWYVKANDWANAPAYGWRTVPDVFDAPDPGPNPTPPHACAKHWCAICAKSWPWRIAMDRRTERNRLRMEYGGVDAWREAAREDRQRVREMRAERNEWEAKNRCEFYDGMVVHENGRPSQMDVDADYLSFCLARDEREREKVERREARKAQTRIRRRAVLAWRNLGYDVPGVPEPANGGIEWLAANGYTPDRVDERLNRS